jgi:hypothetical protein
MARNNVGYGFFHDPANCQGTLVRFFWSLPILSFSPFFFSMQRNHSKQFSTLFNFLGLVGLFLLLFIPRHCTETPVMTATYASAGELFLLSSLSLSLLLRMFSRTSIPSLSRFFPSFPVIKGVIQVSRIFSVMYPNNYVRLQEFLNKVKKKDSSEVERPRFEQWCRVRTMMYYGQFGWHDFRKVSALRGGAQQRKAQVYKCVWGLLQALATFCFAAGVVIALGRPDARNWTDLSLPAVAIFGQFGVGMLHVYLRAVFCCTSMWQVFLLFDNFARY